MGGRGGQVKEDVCVNGKGEEWGEEDIQSVTLPKELQGNLERYIPIEKSMFFHAHKLIKNRKETDR